MMIPSAWSPHKSNPKQSKGAQIPFQKLTLSSRKKEKKNAAKVKMKIKSQGTIHNAQNNVVNTAITMPKGPTSDHDRERTAIRSSSEEQHEPKILGKEIPSVNKIKFNNEDHVHT